MEDFASAQALQYAISHANMEVLEILSTALEQAKMKREVERTVIQKFKQPYPICRKKNGKNVIFYRVDYYDENGKRKQVSDKSYDGLIAKLYLLIKDSVQNEHVRLSAESTIEDVYLKYTAEREKLVEAGSISSQTSDYDRYNWKRFLADREFIKKPITSITVALLENEFRMMCGDGSKYTKKSFCKCKSLLTGIFQQAIIDGILTVNVASLTPLNKCKFIIEDYSEDEQDDMYYSREDILRLREYIRSLPPDTYALGILLDTYLATRIGELRALTWDDYNAERRELKIWHEIIQVRNGTVNRTDKDVPHTKSCKSQGRRIIELPDEAVAILEELRKINGNNKYILNGCRGAKFSVPPNKINLHIRKYCEACGITYHSSHKFRFYGITRLYEAGVNEDKISYLAGHTTSKMTQHYDRSRSDRKKVSREEMAALL